MIMTIQENQYEDVFLLELDNELEVLCHYSDFTNLIFYQIFTHLIAFGTFDINVQYDAIAFAILTICSWWPV